MGTKFCSASASLSDLRADPRRVVKHATEVHRPILITSRGRGVAVVQALADYEAAEEEPAFLRAVVAGLGDLQAGKELSFAAAKARLSK